MSRQIEFCLGPMFVPNGEGMPMPIVTCPGCQKTGNLPDDLKVSSIKCRACGVKFAVNGPVIVDADLDKDPPRRVPPKSRSIVTLPPPRLEDSIDPSSWLAGIPPVIDLPTQGAPKPPVVAAQSALQPAAPQVLQHVVPSRMKTCPYCAEEIQAAAVKCRHCGEIIDLALRAAEEAKAMAIRAQTQQGGPQIINVNNNVAAISGVRARHRGMSGVTSLGIILFFLGMLTACGGAADAGRGLLAFGVLLIVVGSCLSFLRWLTSSH